MNTELAVFGVRMKMESRTRRRQFVALFYAAMTVICFAWCSFDPKQITGTWILCAGMILGTALAIVFSGISGDMRVRGDEREMHRREQAHLQAYSLFGKLIAAALIANVCFRGRNPIAPLLPLALRGGMVDWPSALLMAAGLLYLTLPQAILLWTEPDMETDLAAVSQ